MTKGTTCLQVRLAVSLHKEYLQLKGSQKQLIKESVTEMIHKFIAENKALDTNNF